MGVNETGGKIEASDFVKVFNRYGVSLTDIAEVVHEDLTVVSGWEAGGTRPGTKVQTKLIGLRDIIMVLSDSLSAPGVGQWLHASNRILDDERPLDALSQGRDQTVMEAANAFVDGSYV
ncbi:hypothetical protein [Arthrobacter flavus]|uniref:Antitoxin Xre/MbcA/ParS-like toxin-binding domain-containing protein n=1 Tax=Arthrobacter flavus TaxID=95172 RepID=A0ABW4QA70_9MICC